MCKQKAVVKKIMKAGELNGYAIELVEAQMSDYISLKRDVDSVKESISQMKAEQARQGQIQAEQGGMIKAIFNRLNGPVEQEREDGIFWRQIKALSKTAMGKIILLLLLGSIALAGQRILELIGLIK